MIFRRRFGFFYSFPRRDRIDSCVRGRGRTRGARGVGGYSRSVGSRSCTTRRSTWGTRVLRCDVSWKMTGSGAVHGFGSRVVGSGLFLAGSEGAGLGRAPERGAVEGLAEVRDGHVVRLREGRGRLDLEVRRLDRERGQTAGVRASDARQQEHRAREERHVNYMGHSRRARESAAPPRHGAGMRRFGRRSAVSLPRRRRIARTAGRSRRALGLGAVESAGGGGALQTSFTDAVAKPNRC